MGIISSTFGLLGQDGVTPRRVQLVTTDNLATVTTAGYLTEQGINPNFIYSTDIFDAIISYNVNTTVGTYIELLPTIVNGVITLSAASSTIVLPTIANHIATYTNTSGGLSEDPTTAISGGNIQAGLSGTAGALISFPTTAARGSLHLTAVANAGNTITTISNAAMGQASTISIPDPGVSTSNFIISNSAGTQHIATGSLETDVGNLIAGSSGNAGTVSSFPATAARGSLILAAVNNTGNTTTTLSNAAMAQASVISIPDPGSATANFLLNSGTNTMAAGSSIVFAKVNGNEAANAVTASGSAGVITTSSLTTVGGSSYAITWTNTFISATSVILLTIMGGTNTTKNITLTATAGSGSSTLTIYNNTAATSLNGTILIGYHVI
jgi:hypothetical protein